MFSPHFVWACLVVNPGQESQIIQGDLVVWKTRILEFIEKKKLTLPVHNIYQYIIHVWKNINLSPTKHMGHTGEYWPRANILQCGSSKLEKIYMT